MSHPLEQAKAVGDALAISAVGIAWLGALSTVMTILATTAALVYSCLRVYEWFEKRRQPK